MDDESTRSAASQPADFDYLFQRLELGVAGENGRLLTPALSSFEEERERIWRRFTQGGARSWRTATSRTAAIRFALGYFLSGFQPFQFEPRYLGCYGCDSRGSVFNFWCRDQGILDSW